MANFLTRSAVCSALLAAAFSVTLFMRGYQDIHFIPGLIALLPGLGVVMLRRDLALPNSFPAICIFMLWALCALAFSLSQIPFISQIAFCIFSALPLAFLITDGAGTRMIKPLVILAGAIFSLLAISALYQVTLGETEFSHRAAWPFLNPNSLATTLGLGLAVFAGIGITREDRRERWIFCALFLLIFAGIIATGSRGGLLAALLSVAVLFAFYARIQGKAILMLVGGMIATGLIVPMLSGSVVWHNIGTLIASPASNASVIDRLALWAGTGRLMMDHALIGTGPGTFSFFYSGVRRPFLDQSSGHFAHLDPLQMGSEMGVLAPLIFYVFLIAVLIRTIDSLLAARNDRNLRARIIIPFSALIAVLVHAHICFPLYLMPILIGCGALLGIWHTATTEALGHGSVLFLQRKFAMATVAGISAMLIALAVPAGLAGFMIQKAMQNRTEPSIYLKALARADQIGPQSFIDPEMELARINLRLMEETKISAATKDRYITETDELLNTAAYWNPAWGHVDVLRARLLTQQGLARDALLAYESALKKDAMNADARRAIAEILLSSGNAPMAIKLAKTGAGYPHPLAYREWLKDFIKRAEERK